MTTRTDTRKQFLQDVFVTALEGGIGYWSEASHYHLSTPERADFYAVVDDTEDEDKTYVIDADVIVRGINRILLGVVRIRSDLFDAVRLGNRDNDGGEIDADGADCIVQAGLFEEVRYG